MNYFGFDFTIDNEKRYLYVPCNRKYNVPRIYIFKDSSEKDNPESGKLYIDTNLNIVSEKKIYEVNTLEFLGFCIDSYDYIQKLGSIIRLNKDFFYKWNYKDPTKKDEEFIKDYLQNMQIWSNIQFKINKRLIAEYENME